MKIFYLPIDVFGKGYYRMYLPYKYLKNYTDSNLKVNVSFSDSDLLSSTFIVNQHHHTDKAIDFFKEQRKQGKLIVTDIDDDYWHIPKSNPAKKYWGKDRLKKVAETLRLSNAVIVSTHTLKNVIDRYNKNVHVIPNYVEIPVMNKKMQSHKLRIGYAGSSSHVGDFSNNVISAFLEIHKKYHDAVDLIFLGYLPPPLIGKAHYYKPVSCLDYMNTLAGLNLDIGIAPLEDNMFNKSKSPLKYFEYSAVKAMTIASDTPVYRNHIHPSTGVLLKDKKDDWFSAISHFIFDRSTVDNMQTAAYKTVKANYLMVNNSNQILDTYEIIQAK